MAQVKIHDVVYDLPESFTLKEMRIIERYSGGNQEGYELSKICGVIHVAIMRAKPTTPFEEIEAVIDSLPAEDLQEMLEQADAAGQSPPAESKSENNGSSSAASATSSDADQESETPETSGSPVSDGFQSFHAMSGN